MAWPEEYGGAGADVWHQNVLREEMWAMGEPRGWQYMNANFIGPTIMIVRNGRTEGALSPADGGRRRDLVPGLHRAGSGL